MTRPVSEMFEAVRKLNDEEFKAMMMSLRHYDFNNRFPSMFFLNAEQLKTIPKEVMVGLMDRDIPLVWERLPEGVKQDLKGYQRCNDHTTRYRGDVGPLVSKKDCIYCLKNKAF